MFCRTLYLRAISEASQEILVNVIITVSFSDLNVPVAGLPIEVTRTYDSRDHRQGDFGIGWTLGISNIRIEKTDC